MPSARQFVAGPSDDLCPGGSRSRATPRRAGPGDRVFFEPGEEHWHGAAATRFMTHIAMLHVDGDGNSAVWGDHVSD